MSVSYSTKDSDCASSALDYSGRKVMKTFWMEHSSERSLEEMMLDSRAEELNEDDRPEILSYLPDIEGKRIIELGAGIGRFTTELARKATSVLAVDFMQDFIDKNEEVNTHFGNVEFLCADVTSLSLPAESADIIFSNWLLMYLENREVEQLLQQFLLWLAPGGFLFVRESCRHPSGNKTRKENPTQYREPTQYKSFFASTLRPMNDNFAHGLDTVLSKAVETYVRKKNNCNQMIWLLQKVERIHSENHGFLNFQDFLDNEQYTTNGILRYEKVFGHTFVSHGGIHTTKELVEMLHLKPAQLVLDVGGGIGGSAFYMAQEFGVRVISIDLSSNMFTIGIQRAMELGIDRDMVSFEIGDATKRDYKAESFHVVYCRDMILHIEDKISLLKRFYKWLKPGGRLLISDYCCSDGIHSDSFNAYVRQRGYTLLSVDMYAGILKQAGFVGVTAEDKSDMFLLLSERELGVVEANRNQFVQHFGETSYNETVGNWQCKIRRISEGDQRWGVFYAEKQ